MSVVDLRGRRALVTGGASGIGKGTARRLVEHVGDAVLRALHERINGAQWVVWPGFDVAPYEWNPALPIPEAAT
jgi:NAD(P)-dependent dehydrogenase (short-subunit alcohol dehydrogenase family)